MGEHAEGYVSDYVRVREGVYRVGESRVSLASIVINWQRNGRTPEQIHESFPTLSLAAIYGAIAYYLDHQEAIDAYLREEEELGRQASARFQAEHPRIYAELMRRRAGLAANDAPSTTSPDAPAPAEAAP